MENNITQILLIEDNPGDARIIKELLKESQPNAYNITWIDRLAKLSNELINTPPFDFVLTDLNLPDSKGLETLEYLKKQMPESPFIVLTGVKDDQLGEQAIQKGAGDFLEKGDFNGKSLTNSIKYALERKKFRNNLEKSEKRFKTLIEKNSDGIIVVNRKGIIRYVNPAAEILFGRKQEELMGEEFGFPVINGSSAEITLINSKREPVTAEMRVVKTEWESEHVFICTLRDISQRKAAEKELLEKTAQLKKTNAEIAELNATKNRLFSIIAHDLRNNFNPLLGITEVLAENSGSYSQKEYKDMVLSLNHSFQNQYQLLENLLEWGRIQRGCVSYRPEKIQLCQIVQDNLEILKQNFQKKKIVVTCRIDTEFGVYADKNMLDTIFRNLLVNAVKFSYPRGEIKITAEPKNNFIQVDIQDFGMGIAPENTDKLFNKNGTFTTLGTNNEKGCGLGLGLCKTFIEKHEGDIWVKSEKDKGTTFSFTLPCKHL